MTCVLFMQISLTSGWTLISASAFTLLQYIAFFGVYEENLTSHGYMVGMVRKLFR